MNCHRARIRTLTGGAAATLLVAAGLLMPTAGAQAVVTCAGLTATITGTAA